MIKLLKEWKDFVAKSDEYTCGIQPGTFCYFKQLQKFSLVHQFKPLKFVYTVNDRSNVSILQQISRFSVFWFSILYLTRTYYDNHRNGVVVKASALQSVELEFISPSRVIPKDFKKWYSQLTGLAVSTKGIV